MPIQSTRWREEAKPPIGSLKPIDYPYSENTGGAYQMPFAPLPNMIDSRVPLQVSLITGAIEGGTATPEALQYFVANRTERAGRVYSPRPVSLPGGSFNGDTLYVGTRDTGNVYGG
jgi:hypothetical protein